MDSLDDPVARMALEEIVEIYRSTDADQTEKPLGGADVVEELGQWIEKNHKLLRKLGLVDDALGQ